MGERKDGDFPAGDRLRVAETRARHVVAGGGGAVGAIRLRNLTQRGGYRRPCRRRLD
jgi:hypothetical protein